MPGTFPLVLHVDMDAFFAAVEIRSDPRLRDMPVVVGGGPSGRGVVTAASYAVRRFGVRSGMSAAEAVRRCPHLIVLPVNGPKVIHESLAVLGVLDTLCPRVDPASIDEAYLEFAPVDAVRWERRAREIAERVQRRIREERGLGCSVGAGVNQLQAKMASARDKPNGITVVAPGRFAALFDDAPVGAIPGVGERTAEVLQGMGVTTVGELRRADPAVLRERFGRWAPVLRDHARGGMAATAWPARGEESAPHSAGHETTFGEDTADPVLLRATLWLLADRVARRLRRRGLVATTVEVRYKIGRRRHSVQRVTRPGTDLAADLARVGWGLLESVRRERALRLLGLAGCGLSAAGGTPRRLLAEDRMRERVTAVGDRLRERFGEDVLLSGEVYRCPRRRARRGRTWRG